MGKSGKNKKPDALAASPDRKIIRLKFGALSKEAVTAMCSGTLEAGGFDPALAEPKPPEIGAVMSDGTVYAGVSPDSGKPMYATPADASLTMTFNQAKKYAKNLIAHGHRDWRLPTKNELEVLFNNRAAIGGFNVSGSYPAGWYWSGTLNHLRLAWAQRFSDGAQGYDAKAYPPSVRCVRCRTVRG